MMLTSQARIASHLRTDASEHRGSPSVRSRQVCDLRARSQVARAPLPLSGPGRPGSSGVAARAARPSGGPRQRGPAPPNGVVLSSLTDAAAAWSTRLAFDADGFPTAPEQGLLAAREPTATGEPSPDATTGAAEWPVGRPSLAKDPEVARSYLDRPYGRLRNQQKVLRAGERPSPTDAQAVGSADWSAPPAGGEPADVRVGRGSHAQQRRAEAASARAAAEAWDGALNQLLQRVRTGEGCEGLDSTGALELLKRVVDRALSDRRAGGSGGATAGAPGARDEAGLEAVARVAEALGVSAEPPPPPPATPPPGGAPRARRGAATGASPWRWSEAGAETAGEARVEEGPEADVESTDDLDFSTEAERQLGELSGLGLARADMDDEAILHARRESLRRQLPPHRWWEDGKRATGSSGGPAAEPLAVYRRQRARTKTQVTRGWLRARLLQRRGTPVAAEVVKANEHGLVLAMPSHISNAFLPYGQLSESYMVRFGIEAFDDDRAAETEAEGNVEVGDEGRRWSCEEAGKSGWPRTEEGSRLPSPGRRRHRRRRPAHAMVGAKLLVVITLSDRPRQRIVASQKAARARLLARCLEAGQVLHCRVRPAPFRCLHGVYLDLLTPLVAHAELYVPSTACAPGTTLTAGRSVTVRVLADGDNPRLAAYEGPREAAEGRPFATFSVHPGRLSVASAPGLALVARFGRAPEDTAARALLREVAGRVKGASEQIHAVNPLEVCSDISPAHPAIELWLAVGEPRLPRAGAEIAVRCGQLVRFFAIDTTLSLAELAAVLRAELGSRFGERSDFPLPPAVLAATRPCEPPSEEAPLRNNRPPTVLVPDHVPVSRREKKDVLEGRAAGGADPDAPPRRRGRGIAHRLWDVRDRGTFQPLWSGDGPRDRRLDAAGSCDGASSVDEAALREEEGRPGTPERRRSGRFAAADDDADALDPFHPSFWVED